MYCWYRFQLVHADSSMGDRFWKALKLKDKDSGFQVSLTFSSSTLSCFVITVWKLVSHVDFLLIAPLLVVLKTSSFVVWSATNISNTLAALQLDVNSLSPAFPQIKATAQDAGDLLMATHGHNGCCIPLYVRSPWSPHGLTAPPAV